jgi:hypothetical protein
MGGCWREGCPTADRLSDCGSLFDVSEQADIHVFHPRLFSTAPDIGPVVWANDAVKLSNYLLPRDCPRVTFGTSATTTVEDRQQFGVGEGRVVDVRIQTFR